MAPPHLFKKLLTGCASRVDTICSIILNYSLLKEQQRDAKELEMAEINQIKDRIREIAGRRKNVKLSEIVWVVNQLSRVGYEVSSRNNGHQTLFRVENRRFGVCCHNPGERQVKPCYVDEFIDAMTDLELYDD